ncbi:hypothetical protein AB0F77_04095 [Streptomyces sp. NPDC026672]|uniref:hypothetical protein n=1 Tax=unclassified Streptomyces TaxID=2593676 RepID=UPI00340970BF
MNGHSDRTASLDCSSACRMPPRSRDLAALRRFAEAHAAAHARAATVRQDALCACRQSRCSAHEGTSGSCAGPVVLVLRHDPAVGRVWTLAEVCAHCAARLAHCRVVGTAPPRTAPSRTGPPRTAPPGTGPAERPARVPPQPQTQSPAESPAQPPAQPQSPAQPQAPSVPAVPGGFSALAGPAPEPAPSVTGRRRSGDGRRRGGRGQGPNRR